MVSLLRIFRHCEERSDEAIHLFFVPVDCFAALAMTVLSQMQGGDD